jgi:2,3-bisphosphoglycerate-dependent phosphoglycerate mutase
LITPTQLIAVRHGETAWNVERRLQGHRDIPLNAVGRAQSARLAQALADQPIDAIYASDSQRAVETASACAAPRGLPVNTDTGLRERGFGVLEGFTHDQIAERWPVEAERWRRRDVAWAAEGGETLLAFQARCVATLTQLAAAHAGQTIAVFAHGGVLDMLYRAATHQALDAPRSWALGNASINRVLFNGEGFALVGWNDDAHLAALAAEKADPSEA